MIKTFFVPKQQVIDGIVQNYKTELSRHSLNEDSLKVEKVKWSDEGIQITFKINEQLMKSAKLKF